jgi:hypothetical protein
MEAALARDEKRESSSAPSALHLHRCNMRDCDPELSSLRSITMPELTYNMLIVFQSRASRPRLTLLSSPVFALPLTRDNQVICNHQVGVSFLLCFLVLNQIHLFEKSPPATRTHAIASATLGSRS